MTPVAAPPPPEVKNAVAPEEVTTEAPARRYKFRSTFLLATAIFLFANACISFLMPFSFDPYKFNYRGWSWWTFNALRQTSSISNIALLGSSTMVSANAGSDANFVNKGLDLTKHHRSLYLEHKLKQALPGEYQTFSLAAPGQNPSDAYITLKGMVASHSRPDIVVYGLAPRDFIDSTLTAPGDTDAFKYLTRLVNIDDVAQKVFRSPFSKLDWCLQRLVFTYGYSLDIRLVVADAFDAFVNKSLPKPQGGKAFTWWDRTSIMPTYLPAEIYPEAIMSGPIDRKTADERYRDNTVEYMARYKNPDRHVYKTQMYFLGKIAEFCKKERMELVLVNMPISIDNLRLLKPGGYIGYLQSLKEFSMIHEISFYDLNNFDRYRKPDFHDTVHLNAFGGQKFFDDVASYMVRDSRVRELVAMSGEHLAKLRAIASRRLEETY